MRPLACKSQANVVSAARVNAGDWRATYGLHETRERGSPFIGRLNRAGQFRTMDPMAETAEVRIDKWLWAARVFKTRALALEACKAGHVKINEQAVKPGRPVRLGETIVARTPGPTRTLRVVGIADKRVGAGLVGTLLDDLTPPEEWDRVRLSIAQQVLTRPRGSGRPTKRDRRLLDGLAPESP